MRISACAVCQHTTSRVKGLALRLWLQMDWQYTARGNNACREGMPPLVMFLNPRARA